MDLDFGSAMNYLERAATALQRAQSANGPHQQQLEEPVAGNLDEVTLTDERILQMFSLTDKDTPTMTRSPVDPAGYDLPTSIPVTMGPELRSGVPIVAGFMPAGVLIPDRYEIPYHDARTRKGYQRPAQNSRINELVTDLRKGRVDLPTAVLLNLRNRDARQTVSDGRLRLDLLSSSALRSSTFYVVDGQHRILALQRLIEEPLGGETWQHFIIPFVCMLGASEEQEMEQFHVVNSKAKSVRTDLALLLLRQRAVKSPDIYEALVERGRDWQVVGQTLVERLADESSVWKHRVRLPAMEKGETTIPSASMVTSLKPLFDSPYFGALQVEQQLKILDAFWEGVRATMRPAFDDPKSFAIQKGVGVNALHALLVHVLELVRAKGWSVIDPDSYGKIMEEPLKNIEGDDATGSPVIGLDFWRAGPTGAAGTYSGSAGRRVLTAKLKQNLPEVEIV